MRAKLSVEAGHFYAADLADPEGLRKQFARIGTTCSFVYDVPEPERSLVLLIDDYHQRPTETPPAEVLTAVIGAAAAKGVHFDYIAREAACVPLASRMDTLLQQSPLYRSDHRSHWLVADRGDTTVEAAMSPARSGRRPRPPIAVDVEIWSKPSRENNKRPWACPLLAAGFQMVRLGGLEYIGGAEALDDPNGFNHPQPITLDQLPDLKSWDEMPAVLQLNADAAPFTAERAASILRTSFSGVEYAVDIIRAEVASVVGESSLRAAIDRSFYSS